MLYVKCSEVPFSITHFMYIEVDIHSLTWLPKSFYNVIYNTMQSISIHLVYSKHIVVKRQHRTHQTTRCTR